MKNKILLILGLMLLIAPMVSSYADVCWDLYGGERICINSSSVYDGISMTSIIGQENASWNEVYADTLYYDISNPSGYISSYSETDPIYSAWDKSTGISITESQISDLSHTIDTNETTRMNTIYGWVFSNHSLWDEAYSWGDHASEGYLTSYSETDPIYSAWDKSSGINISQSQIYDLSVIADTNETTRMNTIYNWVVTNHSLWDEAYSWGNHALAGYLSSYSETDPIYSAWDKSTGISITESQISDLNHTIDTNETVRVDILFTNASNQQTQINLNTLKETNDNDWNKTYADSLYYDLSNPSSYTDYTSFNFTSDFNTKLSGDIVIDGNLSVEGGFGAGGITLNDGSIWTSGDLFVGGELVLIDSSSLNGSILVDYDSVYTIGNSTHKFADVWADTLHGSITESQITDLQSYLLDSGDTATGNYTFDTDTFFIDSTNNKIGIGNTNPQSDFEISTDAGATQQIISLFDSTEANTQSLDFRKADGTRASPSNIDGAALIGELNFYGYGDGAWRKGASIQGKSAGDWNALGYGQTDINFYTSTEGTPGILTHAMTIDDSQRVGIGDTSPSDEFTVKSTSAGVFGPELKIFNTQQTSDASLKLYHNTDDGFRLKIGDGSNDLLKFEHTTDDSSFDTIMTIDGVNDRVGIGTTTPAVQFEVSKSTTASADGIIRIVGGDTAIAELQLYADQGAGGSDRLSIVGTDTPLSQIEFKGNNIPFMRITASGNACMGANCKTDDAFGLIVAEGTASRIASLRLDDTITTNNGVGRFTFGANGTINNLQAAYIQGFAPSDWGVGDTPLGLQFATTNEGSTTATVKMDIFENGVRRYSTLATAPATCSIGDAYVDTSGAYCACGATNTWSNMIATGTCT